MSSWLLFGAFTINLAGTACLAYFVSKLAVAVNVSRGRIAKLERDLPKQRAAPDPVRDTRFL